MPFLPVFSQFTVRTACTCEKFRYAQVMELPTPNLALVGAGMISPPAGQLPPNDSRIPRVLSLDAHGHILNWMHWQDAVCLYVRGAVSWTLGEPCMTVHGGRNRLTGEQSVVELHPIVAARGHANFRSHLPSPALTNPALFARDKQLCLYCGKEYSKHILTRDHVHPISQGGRDTWENVVSSCFRCNSRKGGRTPQQANMPLLAIPYRPSWVEHLILSNRNILADQMAFLKQHLPKHPRGETFAIQ